MITPTLSNVCDVLMKLRREQVRLIYETDLVSKADHLYNFCITAIAVRDFFFSGGKADNAFWALANASQEMKACLDIGNTSKHMILTHSTPTTKSVATAHVSMVNVYQNTDGQIVPVLDPMHPDVVIVLPDGKTTYGLPFTNMVVLFYEDFLKSRGVTCDGEAPEEPSGLLGGT